jgi:type I restriction enzyme, R subunit
MFGFTGTPIFADNAAKNALGKRTTKDLFGECLHKYVITDAIKDENVLKFSIEYVGKYVEREDSNNNIDIEVEDIDTKELLESPVRLEKITDYIIHNHARKTHSREFTAMFCVSNIDTLIKYYNIFKQKKEAGEHKLKIATIFSYGTNEDDRDANGFIPDEIDLDTTNINQHSRDSLEEFITDYNKMFGSKFTTKDSQSFYNYYNDISKQVRAKNIDILLVVNMFLTGFDSKPLNTLYVDKNLKYHGLIQAFSRTNRILNEQKSQGNIICFRNLKNATDEAVALFSNKNAKDEILLEPIEKYIEYFNQKLDEMQAICPTVDSANDLYSEEDELTFVKAFRELMRLKNVLTSFSDFTFEVVEIDEQEYEDYKSKYLDLYEKSKSDGPEKVSILNDVDFELELIQRDDINVTYILQLLAKMQGLDADELEKSKQEIMKVIAGDVGLRSKRELIQKFIDENLPFIDDPDSIPQEFDSFIDVEFKNEMNVICELENLDGQKLSELINDCTYAGRSPRNEEIIELLLVKPKIKERRTVRETVMAKVSGLITKFIDGIS